MRADVECDIENKLRVWQVAMIAVATSLLMKWLGGSEVRAIDSIDT